MRGAAELSQSSWLGGKVKNKRLFLSSCQCGTLRTLAELGVSSPPPPAPPLPPTTKTAPCVPPLSRSVNTPREGSRMWPRHQSVTRQRTPKPEPLRAGLCPRRRPEFTRDAGRKPGLSRRPPPAAAWRVQAAAATSQSVFALFSSRAGRLRAVNRAEAGIEEEGYCGPGNSSYESPVRGHVRD